MPDATNNYHLRTAKEKGNLLSRHSRAAPNLKWLIAFPLKTLEKIAITLIASVKLGRHILVGKQERFLNYYNVVSLPIRYTHVTCLVAALAGMVQRLGFQICNGMTLCHNQANAWTTLTL